MTVKIKVSQGKPAAIVPEFENWKLEDYIELCKSREIECTKVSEINFDIENGYVTKVVPGPGEEIDTETEILTVYYADNPEETTAAPTDPPPVEQPTDPPVEPTDPPVEPTDPIEEN